MAATYSPVPIAIGIVQYHSSAAAAYPPDGGSVWEEVFIFSFLKKIKSGDFCKIKKPLRFRKGFK